VACRLQAAPSNGRQATGTENKETTMKLTRMILLAIAFAIPFASTQLASAADETAPAGETEKPAKKKGKKAKKGAEKKEGEEAAK
jgi:hypothetical protein